MQTASGTVQKKVGDNSKSKGVDLTSQVREFVFGIQDGMLTVLGLVTGVSSATAIGSTLTNPIEVNKAILVAGCIEAISGMVSMGVGDYISNRAQNDVYRAEIKDEQQKINDQPDQQRRELQNLFEADGMSQADAQEVVQKITKYPQAWLTNQVGMLLHLSTTIQAKQSITGSITIGLAYVIGAAFPLTPYFFATAGTAIFFSILLTLLGLFTVGFVKGRLAKQNPVISGLQIMIIAGVTALFAYLLGQLVQSIFAVKVS